MVAPNRPSALREFVIASAVSEYPPGFAGIVQSMFFSGVTPLYHHLLSPLYEPVVTTRHVKSEPSTPRPGAVFPIEALVQSSPIVALLAGLIAAFAG